MYTNRYFRLPPGRWPALHIFKCRYHIYIYRIKPDTKLWKEMTRIKSNHCKLGPCMGCDHWRGVLTTPNCSAWPGDHDENNSVFADLSPEVWGSNQWVKKQTSKQAQQTQEIPVQGWKTNTKKHTPSRTILSSSFVFDQKTVPLVFVCSRRVQHISSSHPRAPNISPVVGREMIYHG